MNVLIAHQFNTAMQSLDNRSQQEVIALYSFLSVSDKEHIIASSLTKIVSEENDIYTLRGRNVRIFCTFNSQAGQENIILLDVKAIQGFELPSTAKELKGEITLFDNRGQPIAYIDDSDDKTIFSFNGEPLAYIDDNNHIYGYNGMHLGWFEDQIVWDHYGARAGFTKATCPTFTQFEPFKGFKQFKPFKAFKQFAPFKPIKSSMISSIGLLEFLKQGSR